MFRNQRLTPLVLSLALHAGVLLLVLVGISRDEILPALMIDLRDPLVPGAASVATAPRGERPVSTGAGARSKRPTSSLENTTTAATPQPSPPAPSAPVAPLTPLVPIVEAPPTSAAPPTTQPPREPAPQPATPSREVAPPSPSEPPVGPTATEPAWRSGGGSTVASSRRGANVTDDRESRGGASIAPDHGTSGRGEVSGSAGPRVASVPPVGPGSGTGAEYGPYLTALRERIQQSVRYPASARRRGLAGTVSVEILILANGTIGDVTLLESSTHALLDDAALDAIRSLPLMPLPPELPARPLRVRVPVVFQMR